MTEKYIYMNEIMFVVGLAILIGMSAMIISTLKTGTVSNPGAIASTSTVISTLGTFSLLIQPLALMTIIFLAIVMILQFKEVK